MIILDAPQGTTEWITQRLWRLTASAMKSNITPAGKLSESKAAYKEIDKLIAGIELANEMIRNSAEIDEMDEWQVKRFMAHYNGDSFSGSLHTERGHDCEPDAVAALSEIIGSQIHDVGMVVMGDRANGVVSCSPDGFEYAGGKPARGVEIKSPCLFNYYSHIIGGEMPDDYALQVHAGMAICELDAWHFGSYFKGKPLFHVEVKRSLFTDTLAESLRGFEAMYRQRYSDVMGRVEALAKQYREDEVL